MREYYGRRGWNKLRRRNENPADSDHRDRGEREREWNELVAIYPPARITVSAFSVDIIVTQLDYNAAPLHRSLTARYRVITAHIRGCNDDADRRRPPWKISPSIFVSFRIGFENPRSSSMRRVHI